MIAEHIKKHLSESDPKLIPLVEQITLPLLNSKDVYADLLDSIVSQQLSVKAANTIYNRFLDLFPNRYPNPEWILALEHEQIRAVGLSNQKASYIKNTAQFFIENDLIEKDWNTITDEDIINHLISIKGVGKWTIQMILMFTLQREDIFPIDDLGIQQGMQKLYGLDKSSKTFKKDMENIANSWKPYRSIASRYLWRWKDSK